jgi:hypothetical protein
MTSIDVRYGASPDLQARTQQRSAATPAPTDRAGDVEARLREDTVSLSAGGEKIVNLNRGASLQAEIKSAAVDDTFADKLRRAVEDVFRVNSIFRGTVRSLFGWWKR